VPALKDEVFVAQAGLTSIIKAIVPLQLQYYNKPLTKEYLEAALTIHAKLLKYWDSIDPALKSPEMLDEAPPHVFMVRYVQFPLACWSFTPFPFSTCLSTIIRAYDHVALYACIHSLHSLSPIPMALSMHLLLPGESLLSAIH